MHWDGQGLPNTSADAVEAAPQRGVGLGPAPQPEGLGPGPEEG